MSLFSSLAMAPGIPFSFFGKYGEVMYELEAVMQRPWILNERSQVLLYVRRIVELDMFPNAIEPFEARKSQTVGLFGCQSGPISLVFRFSKQGFMPGEYIKFLVKLTTEIHRPVTRTRVKLMQKVGYRVNTVVETWYQCTCAADGPTVTAGKSVLHREDAALRVPPEAPPTRLRGANVLMSFEYFLRVVVNVEGFRLRLEGDFPIFIGTVPFSISSPGPSPALVGGPSVGNEYDSEKLPLLAFSHDESDGTHPDFLLPPSYDEAVRQCTLEGAQDAHLTVL